MDDPKIKLLAYIADRKQEIQRINEEVEQLRQIEEHDSKARRRIDLLLDVRRLLNKDIELLTEELQRNMVDTRILTDPLVVERIERMRQRLHC